jgi:hypothetical protein
MARLSTFLPALTISLDLCVNSLSEFYHKSDAKPTITFRRFWGENGFNARLHRSVAVPAVDSTG